MVERRKKPRGGQKHPLASSAKLRPAGPALERRSEARSRNRITVQLPAATVERLRNAVYWTDGMTIASFLAVCIESAVDAMERERGAAFPVRRDELKRGRPPK